MNLQYFPLDRQLCPVEIESCESHGPHCRCVIKSSEFFLLCPFVCAFRRIGRRRRPVGFTTSEIRYKWVDNPKAVAILPEVELPQFQVMGYRKRAYTYALTTGKADALIAANLPAA